MMSPALISRGPSACPAGRGAVGRAAATCLSSIRNGLLRVELDDELLLDRHRDVFARGERLHGPLEARLVELEPAGHRAAIDRLERLVDAHDLPRALADLDLVAALESERRDVHLAPV